MEGVSLLPALAGKPLHRTQPVFWEHIGNRAIRDGDWKLVAEHGEAWQLYNLKTDRTELHDLSKQEPERAAKMIAAYAAWAKRCNVESFHGRGKGGGDEESTPTVGAGKAKQGKRGKDKKNKQNPNQADASPE